MLMNNGNEYSSHANESDWMNLLVGFLFRFQKTCRRRRKNELHEWQFGISQRLTEDTFGDQKDMLPK